MKIIQTRLKDMPSSLLAELGSYRYGVFTREEGWSIPSRLRTPGQEYDRFDRSDVNWLIAWHAHYGICGCARLMNWQCPGACDITAQELEKLSDAPAWEMSRYSARLGTDSELAVKILWHAMQLAEQSGIQYLFSAVTPMLENIFKHYKVDFSTLPLSVIQSEDNVYAVKIPVNQPHLSARFKGSRRFKPQEVLPSLGVSLNWGGR